MSYPEPLVYLHKNCSKTKYYMVNSSEPADILSRDHATVVTIEWRYEDLVPSPELMLLFKILDNSLAPITDSGSHVMVHSTIGNGMRELCFYTIDYGTFIEDLNNLLGNIPTLPIGIEYDEDPTWNYATSMRALAMEGELQIHKLAA